MKVFYEIFPWFLVAMSGVWMFFGAIDGATANLAGVQRCTLESCNYALVAIAFGVLRGK